MDPVAHSAFYLALERLLNKTLALDPASQPRLRRWDGLILRLNLQPPGLHVALLFQDAQIRVFGESDGQADARLAGTPLAGLGILAPADEGPAADASVPAVERTGD